MLTTLAVDLDRPLEGLFTMSRQAMVDTRNAMLRRAH